MTEAPTDQTEHGVDIKELRQAASRAKDLERESTEKDRMIAFYRAGINPEDARTKYFVKGYEGDLDPDSIKKEARDAGFLAESGPTPQQQQQLDGSQRIGQVVSGSQPQGGIDKEAALEAAYTEGGVIGLERALRDFGIPTSDD